MGILVINEYWWKCTLKKDGSIIPDTCSEDKNIHSFDAQATVELRAFKRGSEHVSAANKASSAILQKELHRHQLPPYVSYFQLRASNQTSCHNMKEMF